MNLFTIIFNCIVRKSMKNLVLIIKIFTQIKDMGNKVFISIIVDK
jgi:hypothetical protein